MAKVSLLKNNLLEYFDQNDEHEHFEHHDHHDHHDYHEHHEHHACLPESPILTATTTFLRLGEREECRQVTRTVCTQGQGWHQRNEEKKHHRIRQHTNKTHQACIFETLCLLR